MDVNGGHEILSFLQFSLLIFRRLFTLHSFSLCACMHALCAHACVHSCKNACGKAKVRKIELLTG